MNPKTNFCPGNFVRDARVGDFGQDFNSNKPAIWDLNRTKSFMFEAVEINSLLEDVKGSEKRSFLKDKKVCQTEICGSAYEN